MAIRLSFDVIGSTCGDLLRFADAVRAAGAQPEYPLQQSSGPNRIDVVIDDNGGGPHPYPSPGTRPPMPPSYQARPGPPYPQSFPMSGSFPPGFGPGLVRPSRPGCEIEVTLRDGTSHGTQVPLETVGHWRAALDTVLGAAGLDETVRASLTNLRQALSDQPPPGHPGGS